MVGRMPWGLDLPLKPFFGVMGVAPPPAWGRITSLIPRAMGGNLDNKELGAGRQTISAGVRAGRAVLLRRRPWRAGRRRGLRHRDRDRAAGAASA
jgi:hypothetical protein